MLDPKQFLLKVNTKEDSHPPPILNSNNNSHMSNLKTSLKEVNKVVIMSNMSKCSNKLMDQDHKLDIKRLEDKAQTEVMVYK